MSAPELSTLRIKFCGMTQAKDAAFASDIGADAIGLIFYEKSARNVHFDQAKEIIASINPLCMSVVVVVDPVSSFIDEIMRLVSPNLIQFHGSESPQFCAQFGIPYIKAIRMQAGTSLAQLQSKYHSANALLLDTYDKALVGGTGKAFDWGLVQEENQAQLDLSKIILAGGLSPTNLEQAIVQTGLHSVDVNSGVETAPGIKDHHKMQQVMQLKSKRLL